MAEVGGLVDGARPLSRRREILGISQVVLGVDDLEPARDFLVGLGYAEKGRLLGAPDCLLLASSLKAEKYRDIGNHPLLSTVYFFFFLCGIVIFFFYCCMYDFSIFLSSCLLIREYFFFFFFICFFFFDCLVLFIVLAFLLL